jgi:hypothetical protein
MLTNYNAHGTILSFNDGVEHTVHMVAHKR